MASTSSSICATTDDGTFGAAVTLTTIGGGEGLTATAADDARKPAATALAAISILSAIDGCNRRKFDVRNRDVRTPSVRAHDTEWAEHTEGRATETQRHGEYLAL